MRLKMLKNGSLKWNIRMDNKGNIQKPSSETDKKNQLYPVFLKLEQLELLLVGAGNVGLEKLHSLLANSPEAKISIVAPQVKDEVRKLVFKHPSCKIIQREFQEGDLDNKGLVILATDNRQLHEEIKILTTVRGILANVADTPELCDFYLGSIVQKGNLKIAISTNGKSPTAAKRIKEVLHEALPGELDNVIENLHKVRNKLNGNFEYKVKKLNKLTQVLVDNDNSENALRWRRIATYSLLAFGFMLIGYFIFSYIPFRTMTDETVKWYQTLYKKFNDAHIKYLRPAMAIYTLLLGIKIFANAFMPNIKKKFKRYSWLAGAGGFLDSFGGGGWGPIVTSTLITKGRTPKYVIGSVSLTEFFVTLASAFTFFTLIGVQNW